MPAPKGHPPYPGCETGGRPKRFTPEFIDNEADALEEWMKKKDNLFIEGFCIERNYDDEAIPVWARENKKFSAAYKKLRVKQRAALFEGGLKKKYAHPMCALILGHNHGIYAKTEQTISGDAQNPLSILMNQVTDNSKDLIDDPDK